MDGTPYGPYMLLERVSVGGMAEVFRARRRDEGDKGKLLAVKRILPTLLEDPEFLQMFSDEASIAGYLQHPNIARILDAGTAEGYPYIAMEYVWGKDLLQIINRFRRHKQALPPAMACHIVVKLCEALDYAHRRTDAAGRQLHIIHRDCTPQNVLVSYKGEVKLVDFGIAKAAARATSTAAGNVKGKFSYMAPEQLRLGEVDQRVDVYAAGIVLYELLLCDRLIKGESELEVLQNARRGQFAAPEEALPHLPSALHDILRTALRHDAKQRYQWCGEMRNALVACMSTVGWQFETEDLSRWMKGAFATEVMRDTVDLETLPTFEGLALSELEERTFAEATSHLPPAVAHAMVAASARTVEPLARVGVIEASSGVPARAAKTTDSPTVVVGSATRSGPSVIRREPRTSSLPPPSTRRHANPSAVGAEDSVAGRAGTAQWYGGAPVDEATVALAGTAGQDEDETVAWFGERAAAGGDGATVGMISATNPPHQLPHSPPNEPLASPHDSPHDAPRTAAQSPTERASRSRGAVVVRPSAVSPIASPEPVRPSLRGLTAGGMGAVGSERTSPSVRISSPMPVVRPSTPTGPVQGATPNTPAPTTSPAAGHAALLTPWAWWIVTAAILGGSLVAWLLS